MTHRITILGAGTAGTLTANRLHRELGSSARITVIDKDDQHLYQPGLLFVPFGLADAGEIVRPRSKQLHRDIDFIVSDIDHVDVEASRVHLANGSDHGYDVLVVATGAVLLPEETDGLTGSGWNESMFTFYSLDGAAALQRRLESFTSGRLVINVIDMPIKCPVAPLEFAFLADWYLRERGVRDDVSITYVTPLDGAFTKPVASRELAGLLESKGIELVSEFATGEADGGAGRIISWDDRTVDFDLLVAIPAHGGAPYVERSPGLGDALGYVPCDQHTLQSKAAPNVFVIGDAADVPASKAGSVSHFEGEILSRNIVAFLAGDELDASFDGHANCFIETGFHKALLIDFNYDHEPVPGRYPMEHAGLPLMKESRLNHMAKLAFQWIYWHALLPGRELPGVHSHMPPHREPVSASTTPTSSEDA